jgi:hypothetical protein
MVIEETEPEAAEQPEASAAQESSSEQRATTEVVDDERLPPPPPKRDWITYGLVFGFSVVLVYLAFFERDRWFSIVSVSGNSMDPFLKDGQIVIVRNVPFLSGKEKEYTSIGHRL